MELTKIAETLREARDELQRDNDEAQSREVARMQRIVENHAKSYQAWVKWEAEQRERRLK